MSQRYCTNCGERLADGVSFCTNCGTAVEAPAQPAPPPVHTAKRPATAKASTGSSGISPKTIVGGIAIMAALLAVVYFVFLRSSNDATATADIPYPDIARSSVEYAYARFEEGSALFLDVRDRDSYMTMHIPGAIWMPLTDVEARLNELPPGVEILTYCT